MGGGPPAPAGAVRAKTNESCSIAQLDGSDIVYVARVAVPKIVGLSVQIGTRFPALQTSLGKVLLAELDADELERRAGRADPLRSHPAVAARRSKERDAELRQVRARGWAMTDQQLALGIRSVAAPIRDGERVMAAVNVNTHAAETTVEQLTDHHLPLLLRTAGEIGADFARLRTLPQVVR